MRIHREQTGKYLLSWWERPGEELARGSVRAQEKEVGRQIPGRNLGLPS